MSNKSIVYHIVWFLIYVLLQEVLFRNLTLYQSAFCFIYVAFIMVLPMDTTRILSMIVAFFLGLSIDIFENTLGIHAAATTLIAFIRPNVFYLYNTQTSLSSTMEADNEVSINTLGTRQFVFYAFTIILIHHTTFFLIESFKAEFFFRQVYRILFSTLYTLIVVVIFQYLFYTSARKKR